MPASPPATDDPYAAWTRRHLLGLQGLSAAEITCILDHATRMRGRFESGERKLTSLAGVVVGNLFFEPSTRTRTSFSLAAKRLSADTVDFSASGSSLSKGESFIDTALTIEAMGVSMMVVRPSPTLVRALRDHPPALVVVADAIEAEAMAALRDVPDCVALGPSAILRTGEWFGAGHLIEAGPSSALVLHPG